VVLDIIKLWFGGAVADAPTLPPVAAAEQAVIERCLRAYRSGIEHFQAGELALAERDLAETLAHKHDVAEAHFYLGLIHRKRRQLEEAVDCLLLATTFKPDFAEAWLYLGVVNLDRKQYDDAAKNFTTALRIRPDYAEAYNALGTLYEQRMQFRDAATNYKKAIELNPRFALAYSNLANVTLSEFCDADAALAYVQKAIELAPQLAGAHNNLAMILQYQGRSEEALAACERALALKPGAPSTLWIRGFAQLMLGRLEAGWRDYEARKQLLPTFKVRKFPYREWDGSPLAGRSLLVYNEQGIGDEILFASCLPDLLALGGQCVVECSQKLESLFRRSFPAATIQVADQSLADMSYLEALPQFDWQVAAGSLPLHFRRDLRDFPRHNGYLVADPQRIAYWRERFAEIGGGLKVGFCWRSSNQKAGRALEYSSISQWGPIFAVPGVHFFNLQYDECRGELDQARGEFGVTLHDFPEVDMFDDLDETAALMKALDLVISAPTAVSAQAAALGMPCWQMSKGVDWSDLGAKHNPWYPTMKCFRRAWNQPWAEIIEQIASELHRVARAHG
jgi:tetratricopeptide (TPR) repeat protein